jgi:hypothetical protein
MTGPDHYREAERMAGRAWHYGYGDGNNPELATTCAQLANAHANLAAAAATALAASGLALDGPTAQQWRRMLADDTEAAR